MAIVQPDDKMHGKAFISYSRADSNLVLRLAKDLRKAGANIWLDQLDIPVGTLWDREIENALKNANIMIAILSVASTNSENFRNEISYAVAKHKKIIPVLIDNCDTPLNLLRFQRVEFTGDYEATFAQLLGELESTSGNYVPPTTEIPERIIPLSERKKRKFVMVTSAVVVLALAAWTLIKVFAPARIAGAEAVDISDQKAWAYAQGRDNAAGYKDYLDKFPNGQFIQSARLKIDSLRHVDSLASLALQDDQSWSQAKAANTLAAFLNYLKNYPNGKHAREAVDGIESLKIESLNKDEKTPDETRAEEAAWTKAVTLKTIAAFQNYMKTYPNGKHVLEAQKHISALEEQQKNDEQGKKDDQAWQAAINLNTTQAFRDYQTNFPKGKHFNEAIAKMPHFVALTVNEVLNKITVHVRKDRNDKSSDGQIAYNYYIAGEPKYLDAIKEVRYVRNHSTFPEYSNRTYHSASDRNTKFNFKGYQWGFVNSVYVTIIMKDNSASSKTLMDIVYDN